MKKLVVEIHPAVFIFFLFLVACALMYLVNHFLDYVVDNERTNLANAIRSILCVGACILFFIILSKLFNIKS